jgi:hypothetical protein
MPRIPDSLYVRSDNELRYQSINLSYKSLGIKKKTTLSMIAISPIALKIHGIRVIGAEMIKRNPNVNGMVERVFWSILMNILLTTFWVPSV